MKSLPEQSALSPDIQAGRALEVRSFIDELQILDTFSDCTNVITIESTVPKQPENNVNRHDSHFVATILTDMHKEGLAVTFERADYHHEMKLSNLLKESAFLGVRTITEVCDKGTSVNGIDFALFDENGRFLDYLLINRIEPTGNGRKGMFVFGINLPTDSNTSFYLLDAAAGSLETGDEATVEEVDIIAENWIYYQNHPYLALKDRLEISEATRWINEEFFPED